METTVTSEVILFDPCPASIWLLGAAAQCNKQRDHDGNHQITIEWTVH